MATVAGTKQMAAGSLREISLLLLDLAKARLKFSNKEPLSKLSAS